ncbi:hypothetical protein XH99_29270 [Bradyrhizobium nanningense]|uniref:Uncharacterized protein n=1 Tax=Bradyrhizobium nanningense TaxID=1325118 RepID=A0A4Q0RYG8_9BRAD|nr:hypothetical protein XH99_29270 [Bradyrhizobium nanningense]RXH29277.1 hypothetical protein XH84_22520 [Bradyrhizobium nanningense]
MQQFAPLYSLRRANKLHTRGYQRNSERNGDAEGKIMTELELSKPILFASAKHNDSVAAVRALAVVAATLDSILSAIALSPASV